MMTVFLRRGPWGVLRAQDPAAAQAHVTISALAELPERLTTSSR